jgi:hypothetical protein
VNADVPDKDLLGPLPIWPSVRNAYVFVFVNLWTLAKLASIPLLLALAIPLVTSLLHPVTLGLLWLLVGSDATYVLNMAGVKSMIDFVLLLVPVSYFSVRWLDFLVGSEAPVANRPLSFLRPSLLLYGCYPIVVFCNQIYIVFAFNRGIRDTIAAAQSVEPLLFQPHWAYGLVAGVLLETVVVGRLAPAFAAAAFGQPLGLRAAWRSSRGQTLRNGLVWLITYRLPIFLLTYFNVQLLGDLVLPDNLSYRVMVGVADWDERIVWEIVGLPLLAATFLVMALGLPLLAATHRATSHQILQRFD